MSQSEDKEITLKIWRESLSSLLGWTHIQAIEWGERLFQEVGAGTIYHTGIMRFVVSVVIPRGLLAKMSLGEGLRLEERLYRALVKQSARSSPDWQSAKTEVEAVLAEYREASGDQKNR